jgi:class 3 adenylate cyclase/YHS domain-containing protein
VPAPDGEATFAFVDLAGFTAATEAHGDREAVAILRAFRARVLQVLGAGDELVKTIGDAVMLRFATTTNAASALQSLFEGEIAAPDAVLLPRAGAHHGRAVAVEGDYYGAAVNLASRIAGCARPGQLLVTTEIANAAQELGSVITHLGKPALRNISEPIDLWDVRVAPDGSAVDTAIDPVCRMRVPIDDTSAITLQWEGRVHHFCGLPCVSRFAALPTTHLPQPGST